MSETQTGSGHGVDENLRKGRIGVLGIVFFVVAAAAPLAGMTGVVPGAIVLGSGAGVPGVYLITGLTLLLFSVGYAAMSHRVTNAGAFFAYVGRGLGTNAGVASAFVSMVAYLAVQWCIYGYFGAVMSAEMQSHFNINQPWYLWAFLALAVALILSLLGVDVGAKVLGVFMTLELASLIISGVAMLINGGPEGINFSASFSPSNIFHGGIAGTAGIAFAFASASFIGFEATAIYGEETKDPKRAVPRATYLAITIITLLFVVVSFGMVTGMGASKAIDQSVALSTLDKVPLANPANVLISLANQYVGSWLGTLMGWLVLSSLFAANVAFQNSAARYLFAMGRGGVLPKWFDHVNGRGAPRNAAIFTAVGSFLCITYFAVRHLDPVYNLFYWLSAVAVLAIVIVEVLVSISVVRYFSKEPGDVNIFTRVIAPILAVIGLVGMEYLMMSHFSLLAGTVKDGADPTTQSWVQNTTGTVLISIPFVALIIGFIVGIAGKENDEAVKDFVS